MCCIWLWSVLFFAGHHRMVENVHVRAYWEPLTPPEHQPHLWNEDPITFFLQYGCHWWIKAFKNKPLVWLFTLHPLACVWHNLSFRAPTICTVNCTVTLMEWEICLPELPPITADLRKRWQWIFSLLRVLWVQLGTQWKQTEKSRERKLSEVLQAGRPWWRMWLSVRL